MRASLDAARTAATPNTNASAPEATPAAEPPAAQEGGGALQSGDQKRKLLGFLFEERRVNVLDANVGEAGNISASLTAQIIDPEDPEVTGDPLRVATNDAIAEEGRVPVWIRTGGEVGAEVALSGAVPVTPGLQVRVGFNAGASLAYETTQPYALSSAEAAQDLVTNPTIDLPVNANKALAMRGGAEVEVVGTGTLALSASTGSAVGGRVGGVEVGAQLAVGGSATMSGQFALEVRRLEDQQVEVVISKVSERSATASANLEAAVRIEDGEPKAARGSKREPGAVDASVAASLSATTTSERTIIARYTLDLSAEEGTEAYAALVRLDTRPAEAAGLVDGSGVTASSYAEVSRSQEKKASFSINGETLLLARALRTETEGRANHEGTVKIVRDSTYLEQSSFVLTGERSITWQGVAVRDTETGEQASFFHLSYDHTDKLTTDRDIESFGRFADHLGAEEVEPRSMEPPRSGFLERLLGKNDNTRVGVDLYFTHSGIEQLAATTPDEAFAAYTAAAGAMDPKLAGAPVADPAAQESLRSYNALQGQLMHVMRNGGDEAQQLSVRRRIAEVAHDYRASYSRPIDKDAALLTDAEAFAAKVDGLSDLEDTTQTAAFFAGLGEEARFGYMTSIGAIAELVGPEDTMVHRLSLEGDGLYLEAIDEGQPDEPTEGLIAPGLTTRPVRLDG